MSVGFAILALAGWMASCSTRIKPIKTIDTTGVVERAFLVLESGAIVDQEPAQGFFVEGTARDGLFAAEGQILGEGELGHEGHPGWMELVDASFHGDETGRAPFVPYVQGFLGEDGVFRPGSREVRY